MSFIGPEDIDIATIQTDRVHVHEHIVIAELWQRRLGDLPAIAAIGSLQYDLTRGRGQILCGGGRDGVHRLGAG
jgi:hypothetical protein